MTEVKELTDKQIVDTLRFQQVLLNDVMRKMIELREIVADIEAGIDLDNELQDMTEAKHDGLLKWLFKLIVHLAKNGEIRTLLEASFNKQKKALNIVVAFDGDEGGHNATNRFVIEQLCGDPKKFKIGANLEKRMNALEENLEGLTINYGDSLKRLAETEDTLKEINELSKQKAKRPYKYTIK